MIWEMMVVIILVVRMVVVDTGVATTGPSIAEHMVRVPMIVAAAALRRRNMLIRLPLRTSVVEVQSSATHREETEKERRRRLI